MTEQAPQPNYLKPNFTPVLNEAATSIIPEKASDFVQGMREAFGVITSPDRIELDFHRISSGDEAGTTVLHFMVKNDTRRLQHAAELFKGAVGDGLTQFELTEVDSAIRTANDRVERNGGQSILYGEIKGLGSLTEVAALLFGEDDQGVLHGQYGHEIDSADVFSGFKQVLEAKMNEKAHIDSPTITIEGAARSYIKVAKEGTTQAKPSMSGSKVLIPQ